MSRAFVKESDTAAELPERAISTHRNLVTQAGLAQIEAAIRRLEALVAATRQGADTAALASAKRDLRYWQKRRGTAELVPAPVGATKVRFGSTVRIVFDDGTERRLRIVGEDEADPAAGSISYVSPVATALIGAAAGERVAVGPSEGEILEILA